MANTPLTSTTNFQNFEQNFNNSTHNSSSTDNDNTEPLNLSNQSDNNFLDAENGNKEQHQIDSKPAERSQNSDPSRHQLEELDESIQTAGAAAQSERKVSFSAEGSDKIDKNQESQEKPVSISYENEWAKGNSSPTSPEETCENLELKTKKDVEIQNDQFLNNSKQISFSSSSSQAPNDTENDDEDAAPISSFPNPEKSLELFKNLENSKIASVDTNLKEQSVQLQSCYHEPSTPVKINGDHIQSEHELFPEEEGNTQTSRSSSTHELIIDQPDESNSRELEIPRDVSSNVQRTVPLDIFFDKNRKRKRSSHEDDRSISFQTAKRQNFEKDHPEDYGETDMEIDAPKANMVNELPAILENPTENAISLCDMISNNRPVDAVESENRKDLCGQQKQFTDFRQMFQNLLEMEKSQLPKELLCSDEISKGPPTDSTANMMQTIQENTPEPEEQTYASGTIQDCVTILPLLSPVTYKCFKCQTRSFETLSLLRDHQKQCLFKESRRKDPCPETIISGPSSNLQNGKETAATPTMSDNLGIQNKPESTAKTKKRVFLCSVCGTYYESWNLFLHMREVHKRHICLYCVRMFPTAERLTLHLEMKHDLEQNHFDCQERLLRSSTDSCYLMCCTCEHLFTEQEEFSNHMCSELMQPCNLCGLTGKHGAECKASQTSTSSKTKRSEKTKRKIQRSSITALPSACSSANKRPTPSIKQDLLWAYNSTESQAVHKEDKMKKQIVKNKRNRVKVNGLTTEKPITNFLENCENRLQNSSKGAQSCVQINESQIEKEPPSAHQPNESADVRISSKSSEDHINNNNSNNELAKESIIDNQNNSSLFTNYLERPRGSEILASLLSAGREDYQPTNTMPAKTAEPAEKILDPSEEKRVPPLLVPKFKLKIPKEFQKAIDSEHSSTETEEEHEEEEEEEQQELNEKDTDNLCPEDMDIEDPPETETVSFLPEQTTEQNNRRRDFSNESPAVAVTNTSNFEDSGFRQQTSLETQSESKMKLPQSPQLNDQTGEKNIENTENDQRIEVAQEDKSDYEDEGDRIPEDGIFLANEETQLIELTLEEPLDKIDKVQFLRTCLRYSFPICLYCNHARRLAVSGKSLALHMLSDHRFSAIVNSITAEELQPSTIVMRLKNLLEELDEYFFNMETYCNLEKENNKPNEKLFECFQCRFSSRIHKDLYLHNRKMHLRTAILCFMCRINFFSYSELLCHICPGQANKCHAFDVTFRCCICDLDNIPSAFRLMVHLRKKHFTCDICLEDCFDQSRLASHAWKHKLHHLCYRCGIAYRNKPDITKHLFWKHGTESVICKRCLQKRWPHVYHFCIPPATFVCETCQLVFTKAMYLKVHKRLHTGDAPYPCTENECNMKFISKKLLLKHVSMHSADNGGDLKADIEQQRQLHPLEEIRKNDSRDIDVVKREKEIEHRITTDTHTEKQIHKAAQAESTRHETKKRKKKKSKKVQKENIDDLMNMPAPNLSESDSSDDSDNEAKKNLNNIENLVPKVMLSPPSEADGEDEPMTIKDTGKIMDIWANFKTFQATQVKTMSEDDDNEDTQLNIPILHVAYSDHAYCRMFKDITNTDSEIKDDKEEDIKEIKETSFELKPAAENRKKAHKSPKKFDKSGSDSSSSSSSSGSDSSCSCGTNCSCSSSSGSSSNSSSSSDDSDSASSEGKRRIEAKRAAKQAKRNRVKSENSSKANNSDIVDVVNTDSKHIDVVNVDDYILELDLETDETETDEDFYDEHPQRSADQLLAEKRRQLMLQTCLSPAHSFDIVENSRPSTPSLPEEMIKEKKVKLKKKKKERKTLPLTIDKTDTTTLAFNPNIPTMLESIEEDKAELPQQLFASPVNNKVLTPPPPITTERVNAILQEIKPVISPSPLLVGNPNIITTPMMSMPTAMNHRHRFSTGSSSDADGSLKRSKRHRRPNRFYGYSSDEEGSGGGNIFHNLSGPAAFKPTPPPILTWRKEDLPAPSKSMTKRKKIQFTGGSGSEKKHSHKKNKRPLAIPPFRLRPMELFSHEHSPQMQTPPVVEPVRVPPVPVHHIQPPSLFWSSKDSAESESSDEEKLTISTLPVKKARKQQKKLSKPVDTPIFQTKIQESTELPKPLLSVSSPQIVVAPPAAPSSMVSRVPPALLPNPDPVTLEYFARNNIRYPVRPPAGARQPRDGESVYCYCRCPYDEVSEMIACDGDDCVIEWFHFECVGILVPPQGKWYCPECRPRYPIIDA